MPHIEFSESADLRDTVKFSVEAGRSLLFFTVCIGRKRQAMYLQHNTAVRSCNRCCSSGKAIILLILSVCL